MMQQPGLSRPDKDKETPARDRNAKYLANLDRFAKNLAKAVAIPMHPDAKRWYKRTWKTQENQKIL